MPRVKADIKEQIKLLSRTDLEKIVIKIVAKDKAAYDFLLVNYFNKETRNRGVNQIVA